MSHHHDHHHDHHHHDHHHDHHHHDHDHHHSHSKTSEMSMEEKLAKLLDHWMLHNEEHAKSYELWATRAKENGLEKVASLLETAAEKTRGVDADFKAALEALNA